jgi:hypothetical protein
VSHSHQHGAVDLRATDSRTAIVAPGLEGGPSASLCRLSASLGPYAIGSPPAAGPADFRAAGGASELAPRARPDAGPGDALGRGQATVAELRNRARYILHADRAVWWS